MGRPPDLAVGGQGYCLRGPAVVVMGAVETRWAVSLLAHGDVLQHVVGAGVDQMVLCTILSMLASASPRIRAFDASPSSRDLVLNTVDAVL